MSFVLPAMHERYFFSADVLAVVYVFCFPQRFYLAILIQAASFFSYLPYLFEIEPVPIPWLAFLVTFVLVSLVRNIDWKGWKHDSNREC